MIEGTTEETGRTMENVETDETMIVTIPETGTVIGIATDEGMTAEMNVRETRMLINQRKVLILLK